MQLKLFELLALNFILLISISGYVTGAEFWGIFGSSSFSVPLNQEDNTNLARVLTNHIPGHHSSIGMARASFPAAYYDSQAVLSIFLFLAIQ